MLPVGYRPPRQAPTFWALFDRAYGNSCPVPSAEKRSDSAADFRAFSPLSRG